MITEAAPSSYSHFGAAKTESLLDLTVQLTVCYYYMQIAGFNAISGLGESLVVGDAVDLHKYILMCTCMSLR